MGIVHQNKESKTLKEADLDHLEKPLLWKQLIHQQGKELLYLQVKLKFTENLPMSISVKPSALIASIVLLSIVSRQRLASWGSSNSRA